MHGIKRAEETDHATVVRQYLDDKNGFVEQIVKVWQIMSKKIYI